VTERPRKELERGREDSLDRVDMLSFLRVTRQVMGQSGEKNLPQYKFKGMVEHKNTTLVISHESYLFSETFAENDYATERG
jgi:hypothetical protein